MCVKVCRFRSVYQHFPRGRKMTRLCWGSGSEGAWLNLTPTISCYMKGKKDFLPFLDSLLITPVPSQLRLVFVVGLTFFLRYLGWTNLKAAHEAITLGKEGQLQSKMLILWPVSHRGLKVNKSMLPPSNKVFLSSSLALINKKSDSDAFLFSFLLFTWKIPTVNPLLPSKLQTSDLLLLSIECPPSLHP